MKKIFFVLQFFFSAFSLLQAQENVKQRIAVFAPLYLDSAFDSKNDYRFSRNVFPKFLNPGLEFYEGVQMALDSLNKAGAPLEVFVYDTRSKKETVTQQISKALKDSVKLFITHCNSNDVRLFADAGLKAGVPVINSNLPNDGGISGNSYFIVLNSTLKTQCEGIYKHLQKYFALDNIVMFRKKGQLEDRIKLYFEDFSKSTLGSPLKIKYVDINDSVKLSQLKPHLDSTRQTICIAGSLDESFGKSLPSNLLF
jgi:hypothetical protein